MLKTNICPCCGRHCDLSEPYCERGVEFREKGNAPEEISKVAGERSFDEYSVQKNSCTYTHGKNKRKYPAREFGDEEARRKYSAGEVGEAEDKEIQRKYLAGESGDETKKRKYSSGYHSNGSDKRKQYRNERYESADTNDRIIINLRELGHRIRFQFEGKGSQERVLEILKERGNMTQRELTERLGIKPGSASELLAKLENAGMIRRSPNDNDRRVVDLSLTEAGGKQAQKVSGLREDKQEKMLSALTAGEKETLLGLLEKVNCGWEMKDSVREDRHRFSGCGGHRESSGEHHKGSDGSREEYGEHHKGRDGSREEYGRHHEGYGESYESHRGYCKAHGSQEEK